MSRETPYPSGLRPLIRKIEHPQTEEERQEGLDELSQHALLIGELTEHAERYWEDYFSEHMPSILEKREELHSELLDEETLHALFSRCFHEYRLRRRDMLGIDHTKFWGW